MSEGIRGLLSRDGQVRRRTLDDLGRQLEYYIPPELRGTARFIGEMSPSAALERASLASRELFAPDRTAGERLRSGADLAVETAGAVAGPVVMGRYLGRPASEVAQELFTGFSVSPAARQADEVLALPPPAREELLPPPPQTIDVPAAVNRQAEAEEYLDLWRRDWGELSDAERARRQELIDLSDTGAFDQYLSEEDLRRSLREFLEDDAFGLLDESPQTQQRFADLRARFPDEEAAFNQPFVDVDDPTIPDLDDFGDWFGGNVNPFSQRQPRTQLPETAPAARVPGANPYEITVRESQATFDPEDGWQPGFGTENLPGLSPLARPQTWRDQGIAGLYSRSARAGDRLQRREYSNVDELRRELEAFGASPKELDALGFKNLDGVTFRSPREDVQEFLRNAPGLSVGRTNKFADYGPSGGRNYTSTTYHHPFAESGPREAFSHFDSVDQLPPLFHSRAAQYDLQFPDGGTTHHVVEIQSDWGQHRTTLSNEALDENSMEVLRLRNEANMLEEQIPGLIERGRDSIARAREINAQQLRREADALIGTNPRAEFDALHPAPYVKNENDWVDAGVRQNLIDAVNSGSDWITFGNGAQAHRHVKMPEEAAKKFYDTRVPKRIEQVLKKFAREAEIQVPRLEDVPFVDGETVKGLRITPELREAITRTGLQSFREGGMVSAAEILMSETPPHSPALEPRTPAPAQAPAKSQAKHKIQRVMGGDGKFRVRFVEQA